MEESLGCTDYEGKNGHDFRPRTQNHFVATPTTPLPAALAITEKKNDSQQSGPSAKEFASCTGPATGTDFGKLLVWAFLAGFAERLVPDLLDRLRNNSKNSTDKKAA